MLQITTDVPTSDVRHHNRSDTIQYNARVTCALLARHKPNSQQYLHDHTKANVHAVQQTTQNSDNYLKDDSCRLKGSEQMASRPPVGNRATPRHSTHTNDITT